MMNDDFQDVDDLDAFVDAYRCDSVTPLSPESQFAADLIDLTGAVEPDATFTAQLAQRLHIQPEHLTPSPLPMNGKPSQEEHLMLIPKPLQQPVLTVTRIPWTLAAALIAVVISMTVLVGLGIWPTLPQSSLSGTTPTPLPQTSLPIPVGGYVSDFSEPVLQKMRDAGIIWIGADLPFYTVSTGTVTAQRTLAQTLITAAHDKGFKILLRVSGNVSDMIGKSDNYNEEYAEFVGYVAAFKPDAIQVWNAQNLDLFWRMDKLNPTAYIELLRDAYTAIKEANPDVMVITGAPAPTGAQSDFPGQIMNDDLYYQGMAEAYAAVGEPIADCLGVDYVEGIVPPDQTSGDSRDDYPTRYFPTMLRRAYTPFQEIGLPVCITELGYLSPDGLPNPLPSAFQWGEDTTADQQADWLAGAIKIASELSSIQIRMVMIWRVNGVPQNPYMTGYAIIRPDGICPACDTIAALRQ
jgi:hypothetical protein